MDRRIQVRITLPDDVEDSGHTAWNQERKSGLQSQLRH